MECEAEFDAAGGLVLASATGRLREGGGRMGSGRGDWPEMVIEMRDTLNQSWNSLTGSSENFEYRLVV